ncbi:replication protein P [Pantoea sp. GL120224-02]|uniref:replication protein P n=1 Tax=Pantoea sp. GL120224-02 TaxID=1378084 RepID=UPI000BD4C2D3|nr:replication protein P [Pantoea sp. GL120224-02]SNY71001.1 phage replication protein P [Pantoea sp. GL120224-02]
MTNREAVFDAQQQVEVPGLAGTFGPKDNRCVDSSVEQLVDILFRSLKLVFPASISTTLKDPRDEAAAKRQWIAAFVENGITSKQQLSAGMRRARASGSPFWPSPGQFIRWCKDGESGAAGLPDENALYDMVMRYSARRGLYSSPEAYPWQENTHYWMVTSLYSQMRAKCLSESELRGKCRSELSKMAKRIKVGECIHPPRPLVEKLYVPVSTDTALEHIMRMKAMLKAKGTRH